MSLAHSKGDRKGQGKEGWELCSSKKSEKMARSLSQPSHTRDDGFHVGADKLMTIHANGNTKPQEPPFLARRNSLEVRKMDAEGNVKMERQPNKMPLRLSGHIHAKPWSSSAAPGRKENPHCLNGYHRVWLSDAGRTGRVYDGVDESEDMSSPRRWNRARKREHYKAYEEEMNALQPHDEKFAVNANVKFWTHLGGQGSKAGGFAHAGEKLEYVPPRQPPTGRHAKGSLYLGKFENVRHSQLMFTSSRKNKKGEGEDWVLDTRPAFDNRLHDDQVRYDDERNKYLAQVGYEFFRPCNTRSCPQMGADYMQR